jgi:crotonobetainyl-CoA:carnitine CoA-transferase CaiB-like acyl-CoA transferase
VKQKPPLRGVRVLDFSRIIAGPNCTMQLGDLGAEIIKVERIIHGDETRHMRPPDSAGVSHFFIAYNRNKKSIAVDMKSAEGLALIRRLSATCDVIVENFRPGVVKRLGIDYSTLSECNPGLVYCSISAYGQTGPMAQRPGLDPVLQAEMGLMALTGEPDGQAMRHPASLSDIVASLLASTAITAALYRRRETGLGEHIDLSLMGSAITLLGNVAQYYLTGGEDPPRTGNSHPTAVPVNAFYGSDGLQFYTAFSSQSHFRLMLETVLQRPDVITDPRFAETTARVVNRDELMTVLQDIFSSAPRDHWVAKIQAAGLPAGPVRTLSDALESPEVEAAGLIQTLQHSVAGQIRTTRSPINLSETDATPDAPPPELGQHTDAVLQDLLGLEAGELHRLRTEGIVG